MPACRCLPPWTTLPRFVWLFLDVRLLPVVASSTHPPPACIAAPLQVKGLSSEIAAAEHEAQQLEAQHQHLKRQQAALQVRVRPAGAGGVAWGGGQSQQHVSEAVVGCQAQGCGQGARLQRALSHL